jgi:hypothetical protein
VPRKLCERRCHPTLFASCPRRRRRVRHPKIQKRKNHFKIKIKIFREIKAKERKSNRKFFSKEFRDNFSKKQNWKQ